MSAKSSFIFLITLTLCVSGLVLLKEYKDNVIEPKRAEAAQSAQPAPSVSIPVPAAPIQPAPQATPSGAQEQFNQLAQARCKAQWANNEYGEQYCYMNQMFALESVYDYIRKYGEGDLGVYKIIFERCAEASANELGPDFAVLAVCLYHQASKFSTETI